MVFPLTFPVYNGFEGQMHNKGRNHEMEKVIGALGEVFMQSTGATFAYNPTGSGITAVSEGRCDIGLSSRTLKKPGKRQAA